MHAILYLVVAAAAGLFGFRAMKRDGPRSSSMDFVLLCAVLGATYLGFAFYLVSFPVWTTARMPFAIVGALLPAAHLRFLDHFFSSELDEREGMPLERALWAGGLLLIVAYVLAAVFTEVEANPGLPERILGVVVFAGFGLSVRRLWQKLEAAPTGVERTRIGYLLIFMSGAVLFSGLEGLGRMADPATVEDLLAQPNPLLRSLELQGPLPPVGALFTGLYLFFLDRVRSAQRLLDLHEVLTQLVTVGISAAALTSIVFLAALLPYVHWTGLVGSSYLVFVCTMTFLLGYPPLRELILARAAPLLNPPGTLLAVALDQLNRELSKVITVDQLTWVVLDRLHNSGRLHSAALYLYQPERQQYRLVGHRTTGGPVTLPVVAPHPFIDGFEAGRSAYVRVELARRALAEDAAARLRILEGMNADLVVPIRSGDLILGWLSLEDEASSDGFSGDEINRLRQLAGRVAIVLENIKGFEASKEQARLAALGTMAAGLAHEIRNPLAGIKGAAQVIGQLPPEEHQEFLQVITDEVDRLNTVVTNFLDYARHFELRRESTDLNALITQVLSLVRAQQDLPDDIELSEELDRELPLAEIDGDKLRQVVLNLVLNAVQALPEEGGGHVSVRTRRGGLDGPAGRRPAAVIEVIDDGEGIPADVRSSLFIPFYTTKPFGTGLGLAISQRLVVAHDGELRVESRVGEGSTFRVTLPLPDPITAVSLDEEANLEGPG
ncbi:MAG: hypothetical protein H6741_30400 [Alphaproteobacteria bacterium]|nr:hypothetical protein [Alphaproteobacteria bacterium]